MVQKSACSPVQKWVSSLVDESACGKHFLPAARTKRSISRNLLDFDLGAGCFDLLLDLFGFFLGHSLLDGLGSPLDESLGVPDVATAVKLIEEKLAEMVARVKQQLPEGRVPNPMASTSSEQTSGTSEDMLSNLQEALADDAVGAGAAAAPSAGTSWAQSAATVSGGVFNTAPPCAYNKSSVPFSRVDKQ